MKASRITALGLVAAAALWIVSGHLIPHESAESRAALQNPAADAPKKFRGGVVEAKLTSPSRKLVLSGRTEADKKVVIFARTNGVLQDLNVRRGSRVKKGEVLAVLAVAER